VNRSAILVASGLGAVALAASASRGSVPVVFAAGMVRREFVDSTRGNWQGTGPRPLTTLIWYPAPMGSRAETLSIGSTGSPVFLAGVASPGAPVAGDTTRYPLIVLSHGTGGSAVQLAWLGTALARRGYIAAAVNHHGNTGAEPQYDPRGFLLWWERARDLSVVLDRVVADSLLARRIDHHRIGAAGFSLGGYTVMLLAGARVDLDAYRAFCRSSARDFTCEPQPEFPQAPAEFARLAATDSATKTSLARANDAYRDPRISAVAALAPAIGEALNRSSLAQIRLPLLVIVGAADDEAPAPTNARVIADAVPGAQLIVLPGVGHYDFLSPCTPRGREAIARLCQETQGTDRVAVHDSVVALVAAFYEQAWRAKP